MKNRNAKMNRLDNMQANLMLLIPFVCLFLFALFPFLTIIYQSFFYSYGLNSSVFVGFDNYLSVFRIDNPFWISFSNSLIFSLAKILIEFIPAFIIAVFLTTKFKGCDFFRMVYFLPMIFANSVAGVIFNFIFNHQYGPINYILSALGSDPVMWFSSRGTALLTIIIASSWQFYGLNMMYLLIGLTAIPKDIYNAASIDGASFTQKIRYVTLPQMKPTLAVVLINSMIGSMNEAEIFMTLTSGSPAGLSMSLMSNLYQIAFASGSNSNEGYLAASAVISSIFISIIALTYAYLVLRGRRKS